MNLKTVCVKPLKMTPDFFFFIAATFLIVLLSGFLTKPLKGYHVNGQAQGTTYHITYYAQDSSFTQADADSIFRSIDTSLSIYKPYSLISRFNREPRGVVMDVHLRNVAKKSLEISKDSRGLFDITVLHLSKAWGFGPGGKKGTVPDSSKIREIMTYSGYNRIAIKGDSLVKSDSRTGIDVNGIAQGYSVDVVAAFLEEKGIKDYLVEVGGEIRVKGRKQPGSQVMKIGIEGPPDNEFDEVIVRRIEMKSGAITTSGKYRNFYNSGNKKISHLMDPRTGYSLQNEMISVTVYACDGITADGYDNVLMGMHLDQALKFLKNHKNLEAYFIYLDKNGKAADTATRKFQAMFIK